VSRSRAEVASTLPVAPASRRGRRSREPAGAAHGPRQPDAHTIGTACERRLAAIRQVPPFPPPRPAVRPCRVHGRCGQWPRRRDGGDVAAWPRSGRCPPSGPTFARVAFTGRSGVPVANGPASRRSRLAAIRQVLVHRDRGTPSPTTWPAVRPCRVHGRKSRPCGHRHSSRPAAPRSSESRPVAIGGPTGCQGRVGSATWANIGEYWSSALTPAWQPPQPHAQARWAKFVRRLTEIQPRRH